MDLSVKVPEIGSTHTHTHLTALCLGLPRSAGTRKVKPVWILLKQETLSGSSISWAVCKSAPCCRQISMLAPHHSVFLQVGCPSCCPTNSVKALKAQTQDRVYWRQKVYVLFNAFDTKYWTCYLFSKHIIIVE